MNHCYKSVWNSALGTWVAVSEIAAARGRSGSSKKLLAAAALALLAVSGTAQAETSMGLEGQICARPVSGSGTWTCQVPSSTGGFATVSGVPDLGPNPDFAALNAWVTTNLGANAIAMGTQSTWAMGNSSVAIGDAAQARGTSAIAMGTNVDAQGNYAIAMGYNADIENDYGIAIGYNIEAESTGTNNTAIGSNIDLLDGSHNVVVGSEVEDLEGNNNVALGRALEVSGDDNVVMGNGATAQGNNTVAIGAGAFSSAHGAVALGAGSVANTNPGAAGYVPPTADAAQTAAVNATTSTLGAVSVGDAATGKFRQINGVAAGTVDSDAVNVAQLKAVTSAAVAASATHYYSVNDGGTQQGNYNNDGAMGEHSLAAGVDVIATVDASSATAIGHAVTVQGGESVGLGSGIYEGAATTQNVMIGSVLSIADSGSQNVLIGANSDVNGRKNVALGDRVQVDGDDNVVIGTRTQATGRGTTVIGGRDARAEVDEGVALGAMSVARTPRDVAGYVPPTANAAQIDAINATTSGLGAVSVGDVSGGLFRQINGVAAGTEDTDAVNVAQLKAVTTAVAASATHYYSVNDGGVVGANYNNDGATGLNSLAAGVGARALADSAVAIGAGAGAEARGISAVAVGDKAAAEGNSAVAMGNDVEMENDYGIAIGVASRMIA